MPIVFPFCRPSGDTSGEACQAEDKVGAAEIRLHQRLGWMGRAAPLMMKSGLLLPLYNSNTLESIIAFSGDKGAHWSILSKIPGRGGIQGSLGERRDGTIVGFFRDSRKAGRVLVSESSDGGRTFGPLVLTDVPNPNAGIQLLVLKDGRWLLFNNNSTSERGAIHVNVSYDEGRTWPCASVVDDERPDGRIPWYAYPAAIQATNGDIHLVYSAQWFSAKDSHDRLSAIRHKVFKAGEFRDCRKADTALRWPRNADRVTLLARIFPDEKDASLYGPRWAGSAAKKKPLPCGRGFCRWCSAVSGSGTWR